MSKMTLTAPECIYLQVANGGEDNETFPADHDGVTWCEDSVMHDEVEYVRSDIHHAAILRDAEDAARYRWLRDKSEKVQCGFYLSVGEALHQIRFEPKTVDNSIDAAMRSASSGGEAE